MFREKVWPIFLKSLVVAAGFYVLMTFVPKHESTTQKVSSAQKILIKTPVSMSISAGFAIEDITPPAAEFRNLYLPGRPRNRKPESLQNELSVRALVLDDGRNAIALVSLDLIGFFRVDIERIRAEVKEIFPDSSNVIVASTHTHSSPDTLGIWSNARKNPTSLRYLDYVVQQSARAIRLAYIKREAASFAVSRGELGSIIRNDREAKFIDDEFLILRAVSAHNQPIVFLNFACHPEFLRRGQAISADYVDGLRDWLSLAARDDNMVAQSIFFNGALGGMVVANTPKSQNRTHDMIKFTSSVMEKIMETAGTFKQISPFPVGRMTETFDTKLDNPNFAKLIRAGLLPPVMKNGKLPVEVTLVRLGQSVVLIAIPGELSPEISLRIRKLFPKDMYVGILGLANDELGYILPKAKYKKDIYKYERSLAVNEEIGEQIFSAVKKMARDPR